MSSLSKHIPTILSPTSVFIGLWLCSAMVLGLFVFRYGSYLVLGGVISFALLALILTKPQFATLAFIFILYTNSADVAYTFHGVPKLMAASVTLILGVPLIIYIVLRREKLIVDRTFVLMLVFFIVVNATGLLAKDAAIALKWIADYFIEGIVLYFLIVNVVRELGTLRRAIWTLLLAGSLMGGLSLFQEVTHTQNKNYGGFAQVGGEFAVDQSGVGKVVRRRAAGPIGEKNRYAQVMLVLLPLALFRFWGERSRALRLFAAAGIGLILSGVLLTFSRGAFVGTVLLVILMILMRYLKLRQALVFSAVFLVLLVVTAPDFVVRIESLGRVGGLFSDAAESPDHAMRGRFAENLAALQVFLDHPILGVGPGQFAKFYSTAYVDKLGMVNQKSNMRAHSLYLEMAAETGIVGFVCFMAIVLTTLYPLWEMSRRWRRVYPGLANIAAAFVLSIVAYLATGIFLQLAFPRYFWVLMALSGAASRILESEGLRRAAIGAECAAVAARAT